MAFVPIIRTFTAQDYQGVIALLVQLQASENAVEPNRLLGEDTAIKYFAYIQSALADTEGIMYVAIINDDVVGLLILFIEDNDLVEQPGKNVYISDIVVDVAYRQEGLGSLLLEKAEDYAKVNGIRELRICVLKQNLPALKLYHKSGFYEREICLAKYL